MTLAGANTYAGGTTINEGLLVVGNGAAAGFISGPIAVRADGTLVLDRTHNSTFSNTITGAGRMENRKYLVFYNGNLSGFTGRFTALAGSRFHFTGGSGSADASWEVDGWISSGISDSTVHLGELSGSGVVSSGGGGTNVTFSIGGRNASSSYAGIVTGGAHLVKVGTGTLTLAGANTYTGATTVSNGTLLVNGSLGTGGRHGRRPPQRSAAAARSGDRSPSSGTLAPGGPVGTLTVSNNLVLAAGATLAFELGTNSDRVAVAGNLTLDGTLNVADAGGFDDRHVHALHVHRRADRQRPGDRRDARPRLRLRRGHQHGGAGEPGRDADAVRRRGRCSTSAAYTNAEAAAGADPDGDGLNNEEEFLAGTQPTNSASVLQNVNVAMDTNGFYVVTWDSVGGKSYRVQYSDGDAGGGYADTFVDIPRRSRRHERRRRLRHDAVHRRLHADRRPAASNRFYRVRLK